MQEQSQKIAAVRRLLEQNDVLLAPMAGVTDQSFREICRELCCGLTYTEMVSAKGLYYGGPSLCERTRRLLAIGAREAPAAVQLFGSDSEILAKEAAALCGRLGPALALIDINMGCPVHKIVSNGDGSALMLDIPRAKRIVEAVNAAVPLPVTVKFRKGWDDEHANAVEFAREMEKSGAAAVTVHGRTRAQLYAGKADWSVIARVKEAVAIPVVGNGDVFSPEDYFAMKQATGCDAVMIARGAQGNPWIFEQIAQRKRGEPAHLPTAGERLDMALRHARGLTEQKGPRAVVEMRKHVAWYVKSMRGAAAIRTAANRCTTYEELEALLNSAREDV